MLWCRGCTTSPSLCPRLPNVHGASASIGAVTAYISNTKNEISYAIPKDAPGADKLSNWLPAPNDTIYLVLRLYWPKTEPPSILPPGEGTWKPPALVKVQ